MFSVRWLVAVFFCNLYGVAYAQTSVSAPLPQPGIVAGVITDADGAAISDAKVTIVGNDRAVVLVSGVSNGTGGFSLSDVPSAVPVTVSVTREGFAPWSSSSLSLTPGQYLQLPSITLAVETFAQTVDAVFPEQLAAQQVKEEEKQRVFGVIPNFYVAYDHNAVPLTTALKFHLAMKASTDVVTIAGAGFVAGIYQASDRLDFPQGAKGYGQRLGVVYADGITDIFIGGAILPSLLHQDPRYFYQGTGTTKSRLLHALSAPFICKGDNGKWQFNYSTIGGDLASGAISNAYYPSSNRGPSLVINTALTAAAGRALNAVAQEFILKKITSGTPKN